MEGKTSVSSSSSSSSKSTKISSGIKEPGKKSSSGLFKSVFPPPSTVMTGRDSPRSDIFGPSRNHEYAGGSNTGHNFIKKDTGSVYQNEKTDPCHLSSSLYYGAQDVYASHSSKSYAHKSTDNYKKDVTNNSESSRGDWWEGSLYY